MANCGILCGKLGGVGARWWRESLWKGRKVTKKLVRESGKVFGFVEWRSVFAGCEGWFGGKSGQGCEEIEATIFMISTYPITTTTNILRKKVFKY